MSSFLNTNCFLTTRFVATDSRGRVVVSDYTTKTVWIIGADGMSTRMVAGNFSFPEGVAVDSMDRIIVADRARHQITVFDPDSLLELFSFGRKGVSHGRFNEPMGVAVDLSDNIYVADSSNHRIQVFNQKGEFIETFGDEGTGSGEFRAPSGIAVDAAGRVLVAESLGNRVQIFDTDRTQALHTLPGLRGPHDVTTDCFGFTYVTESGDGKNTYKVFAPNATTPHITRQTEQRPAGIAVTADRVLVCTGMCVKAEVLGPERSKLA
jgi:DNA-binding beta-propeller fold protein YncE